MVARNSYTFKLDASQQAELKNHLETGNYRPLEVPYTSIAAQGRDCTIALYEKSGKCLVQGKGAEEWVTFVLEPRILLEVGVGYDEVLSPEIFTPHIGVDESGKGDFFGPMVIAAAYVDKDLVESLREMDVKDSKRITSDKKALEMARDIRKLLGDRFTMVTLGPAAYNRLYASMRNVNAMLAWGHARAIEDLLARVPDCPRALSDQFGPARQIEKALMKKGKHIKMEQRPKAESDPAVAAASILARAGFVDALRRMQERYDHPIPKGASAAVKAAAVDLVRKHGPKILLETSKCHFQTADKVLAEAGSERSALGPEGAAKSKAWTGRPRRSKTGPSG